MYRIKDRTVRHSFGSQDIFPFQHVIFTINRWRSITLLVIVLISVLMNVNSSMGQSVGLNNATPHVSSILDLTANDRGFLVPRMITTDRLNITSPATGLIVFDTDLNAFRFYNGTVWTGMVENDGDWTVSGSNMYSAVSGNVGIGQVTPSHKLDIMGVGTVSQDYIRVLDNVNVNQYRLASDASGNAFVTIAQTAGSTNVQLHSSGISYFMGGDFGIGDATPDGKLEVRQTGTADIFNLYDNTTNVLTVLDGGNVGIGTSSPTAKLHILASTSTSTYNWTAPTNFDDANNTFSTMTDIVSLTISNNGGTGNVHTHSGTGTANIDVWDPNIPGWVQVWSQSVSTSTFNFDGLTVSFAKQDVGGVRLRISPVQNQGFHFWGGMLFTFTPSDAVAVFEGSVGIGTTSPTASLDIAGSAKMTGFQLTTSPTAGYVLSSDASGVGTWTDPSTVDDGDWTVSGSDMYSGVSGNVGIGTSIPDAPLEVVGRLSLQLNTRNVVVGKTAGTSLTTGGDNTFLGYGAGGSIITTFSNTFVGSGAGSSSTSAFSTFIGYNAGANTTGIRNIFLGYQAGNANSSGTDNTYLGYLSGLSNTTGSRNVYLGYQAGRFATGSDELYIANASGVPLIFGNFSTNSVGLGTTSPDNTLDIVGTLDVSSTSFLNGITLDNDADITGADQIVGWNDLRLYGDASGGPDLFINAAGNIGIGETVPNQKLHISNAGSLFAKIDAKATGRAAQIEFARGGANSSWIGPTSSNQFHVWTDENIDMLFGTNGTERVRINANGNVGIGTPGPNYPIHVRGSGTSYVAGFDKNNATGSNLIRFMRQGSFRGNITESGGTVSYNPFTGSHYGMSDEKMEKGILVTMTGQNKTINDLEDGEPIYGVAISTQANDPKILGAYLDLVEDEDLQSTNKQKVIAIMAVGNGEMWVVDNGENLEIGDYLISSSVAGHAMKDKGKFDTSYIIARVAESVDWSKETQTIDGVKHTKISMFFESFTIEHSGGIKRELELLKKENDNLKADIEEIQQYLEINAQADEE